MLMAVEVSIEEQGDKKVYYLIHDGLELKNTIHILQSK